MILALVLVCTSTADCLCWLTANRNALIPFCNICFLRSLSAFSCWAYLAFLQASKHFCCISVCQKVTALYKRDKKTKLIFVVFFPHSLNLVLVWNYFKSWIMINSGVKQKKVRSAYNPRGPSCQSLQYPSFHSMQWLGVFNLLPTGWEAACGPSQA